MLNDDEYDEWWCMMNAEYDKGWWMMNDGWWMMNMTNDDEW